MCIRDRPIDSEKAQAGHRYAKKMGVALAHQLVALLRSGIERHRMIDAVVDTEWQRLIAAVDRRGAGIDEMPDSAMTRELQHVYLAHQVRADIGLGIDQRIT